MKLLIILLFSFLLNLPFGWLRRKERKFSFKWFLYIHLPIPLIIALRIWLDLQPWYFVVPLVIAAAVAGQAIGARLKFNPEPS